MGASDKKRQRHEKLTRLVEDNPFLTDEKLSALLGVSLPTVRLDRSILNIPECRTRVQSVAASKAGQITALSANELVGEFVDIERGHYAVALLLTTGEMQFVHSGIVRGHFIYSFAESLAIAVIDAQAALVEVANIKYKKPVYAPQVLSGFCEIKKAAEGRFTVWVKIKRSSDEVFRGKFILRVIEGSTKFE